MTMVCRMEGRKSSVSSPCVSDMTGPFSLGWGASRLQWYGAALELVGRVRLGPAGRRHRLVRSGSGRTRRRPVRGSVDSRLSEGATGGAGKGEGAGTAVAAAPFGGHVGHDASVVGTVELQAAPMARARSMLCIHVSRVRITSTRYPIFRRSEIDPMSTGIDNKRRIGGGVRLRPSAARSTSARHSVTSAWGVSVAVRSIWTAVTWSPDANRSAGGGAEVGS